MHKFLKNYGKQIMAVSSAFLMIAFMLPSASRFTGPSSPTIGTIGKQKLSSAELSNARRSWELLNTLDVRGNKLTNVLGPDAAGQISKNPVLFLLLQKEAQNMGVTVSKDELESVLANLPGLITTDEERNAQVRRSIADLLLVRQGFARAASTIKITDPMVKHELAQAAQTIMVRSVDFTSAKYLDKVPAPSAEQLKTQFEKFADVPKGAPTASDPFGFGYRYPDRVKLQYLVVPESDVRKAVEATKTPYEWRVEAQKYYLQNTSQFATTQEAPKTGGAFSLEGGAAKKTPTTRPFTEVDQQITKQLVDGETTKRINAIVDRINSTLSSDWTAFRSSGASATRPATVATTTPGGAPGRAPYGSFEYLQKLAASIQTDFKVLPTVVSMTDKWLSAEDLAKIPGLGQANYNERAPMANYIMALTAPFLLPEQRNESGVLQLLEPSRQMRDTNGSVYIVRVTEADPSHKPASLTEVEPAVRADYMTANAYELAKADATKLLDAARKEGLTIAAAGKGVVSAGPLNNRQGQSVPSLALTGPSATDFIQDAFQLLATPTSRPAGQPVELIELRHDGRAIVTELSSVEATWTQRSLPMEDTQVRSMIGNNLMAAFSRDWYDYNSVASRLNYVPDASAKDSDQPIAPPQPTAPIF